MTEQIAVAVERLNFAFLLVTHMVCADQQIHSEEAKALQALAINTKMGERTIVEMEKILAQEETHLSVYDVARQVRPGEQSEAMRQVLAVAYIDGFFSPVERAMVEQIAQIWNWTNGEIENLIEQAQGFSPVNKSSENKEDTKLSFGAILLKGADSILSRALVDNLANIVPENIGRQIKQSRQELLLSGKEYDSAIQQCAAIATEDYKYAALALKGTTETLHNLGKGIQEQLTVIQRQATGKGQAKTAAEVAKQLEATRKALTVEIMKEIESVRQSLSAKERALNHFSIAFMGKTKAGKSTLHAIITGDGWEAIGVGKQRTTRFNRVYEWKNIRIIDTPGIGAPGGKTDEEIAEDVIEESDVICYVVTNDSIQETEFKFLQLLKEKAKPLIILLNVKNNLRDSRRLEHFLANPQKLFAVDGQSNLGGHIERIRRYAKQNYANDYFEIIPIMLLAAQMSREPEHEEIKDKLFQSSQMQKFLDSIRLSLVEYGKIRRSQTLLGSTVGSIDKPHQWVIQQEQVYQQLVTTLKDKYKTVRKDIQKAVRDNQQHLLQQIEAIFQDVSNSIPSFAEEFWDANDNRLNQGWEQKLKAIRFEQRLKTTYEESSHNFNKEIQEILEEVGNELQIVTKLINSNFKLKEQDSNSLFHDFMKIGGNILTIAAPIVGLLVPTIAPIAAVIGIIGFAINQMSGWAKSKEQKRREAVQNICQSLSNQLINQQQNTIQQAKTDFNKYTDAVSSSISVYFEEMIQGLEIISNQLETAKNRLNEKTNYLNRAYAKRIIDWCTDKYEPLNDEVIINTISKVTRDFGKSMVISTKVELQLRKSSKDIARILQEEVSIQSTVATK
ncbi:50S ribosome-binding GTPase [Nostoc sp. FACHB-152]|uniref:GTPase n=1 Tax=unclassified Nostoc TaxID=2593658 RepID=UPI0016890641|nr:MULTISPECIES: GTPase [unclassified Nostoc]MBD2445815.1 50S ribosome-binding GTPase [Nostoc sp. FACHB-152]MBD2468010.1 50S ribosome-binding GTPase [Nostoc sp. FACHB-145]